MGKAKPYAKLRGSIREKYPTQDIFAEAMDLSPCSLSLKLNNRTQWTAREIRKACELLAIPIEEIPAYFFYFES